MINLLPPLEQQRLAIDRSRKLVIVLGSVTIISLLALILVLLSLKFYILEDIRYHQSVDTVIKNNQGIDLTPFKESIRKYNNVFSSLDIFYKKEIYLNDALTALLQVPRSAGLSFTSISARREADGSISIDLAGVAATRDGLLAFKQNLESSVELQDGHGHQMQLKNIYFPPDSWVTATNVDFNITLQVAATPSK